MTCASDSVGFDRHLGANLVVATEGIPLLYHCMCLLSCTHLLGWLEVTHSGTIMSCGVARVRVGGRGVLSRAQHHPSLLRALLVAPWQPLRAEAEAHPAQLFFPD